jgi:uncharacterized protein
MRTPILLLALTLVCGMAVASPAEDLPAAIYTDPPHDPVAPADMVVLHVPSHGVEINGIAYRPSGAGPHPTLVIFHGLPGNEKNLDLAQAARRAGWVAVTFNYRGSWGSPGRFSFAGTLEDATAVLAYLRDREHAMALHIDPARIAIAGHSMGGWIAAQTAARDGAILGAAMISAWDPSQSASRPRADVIASMRDDMESLSGVTAESMADELITHRAAFDYARITTKLAPVDLLVLTSDDGGAGRMQALARAISSAGGHRVRLEHEATDHGWSDRRIALETRVLRWLASLERPIP